MIVCCLQYNEIYMRIDEAMVVWLRTHVDASINDFWNELYRLYNTPEMIQRFGSEALEIIREMIK